MARATGETCEPTDATSCGDGLCATSFRDGFTCNGFGPPVKGGISNYQIGGAQQAQQTTRTSTACSRRSR